MWGLLILSVVLMISDHRYHQLDAVKEHLLRVVYPVQWIVDVSVRSITFLGKGAITYAALSKENERLKDEQLINHGKLQTLAALQSENSRLRELLQSSPRMGETLTIAEILQVDAHPFNHQILLNKGHHQGVYLGQPLIDAKGIMGEITEVHASTSRAMLLTDASHGIPVENVRNGIRSIAIGTGNMRHLELQHVSNTMDLKEGDLLVTSGLGGRYPNGYPVGTIDQIEHDPTQSFARVKVIPSAQLQSNRQVLLIQRPVGN